MEISFTRFRIYGECPYKYKLLFTDGKRIPLTPSSSLGMSLHRALERFHRKNALELDALLDCLDEEWVRGGYADAQTRMDFYEKGRRILEKYYRSELERRTEIVGVEREFIYPLGSHTVRGMIDRVDRHQDGLHEVIDYKTNLDEDLRTAESSWLQLRFYALGIKECLGLEPGSMTIHYLAAGKRETRPYDESGEEALKAWILEAADKIERRQFPADLSFCPRCDFRKTCPLSAAKG